MSASERTATVEFIQQLNELNVRGNDDELAARIAAYDLAFKMQMEAPQAIDVSSETQATLDRYGVDQPETDDYGRRCLMARRLVERGVPGIAAAILTYGIGKLIGVSVA